MVRRPVNDGSVRTALDNSPPDAANRARTCRRATRARVNPGQRSFVHHGQNLPRGRRRRRPVRTRRTGSRRTPGRDRLTAAGEQAEPASPTSPGRPDPDRAHAGAAAAAGRRM